MIKFKTSRELAVYVRECMDEYLGRELPEEFKKEFLAMCEDGTCKKQIFRGNDFSTVFRTVLGKKRMPLIEKVLVEAGFYEVNDI